MAYTASTVIIDPQEGVPVKAKVKCEAFRIDTGAKHGTIAYTSSAGVVTFTDLVDGVWYIVVARVRRGVNPIFELGFTSGGLPSGAWAGTAQIADVTASEAAGSSILLPRGDHGHKLGDGVVANVHVSGSADINPNKIQPNEFFVRMNTTQANLFGSSGTWATVLFDTVIVNTNNAYNTGDGKYTAPETGRYQFNVVCSILNLTANSLTALMRIETSNREIRGMRGQPGAWRENPNNVVAYSMSVTCDMEAGDFARVQFVGSGEASDTLDIEGHTSAVTSHFSGFQCA